METHQITSHDMTWHDISQLTTLPHLTSPHNEPQYVIAPCNQPHQNRSPHHHHGTAEGSFTQKTRFGHRSGWSPCAHSIGKFFLWLIVFFFETSAPGLPGSTCTLTITITITITISIATTTTTTTTTTTPAATTTTTPPPHPPAAAPAAAAPPPPAAAVAAAREISLCIRCSCALTSPAI